MLCSKTALLVVFLGSMLSGCSTTQQALSRISLDMNKTEVIKELGDPQVVRGSIRNKYGQVIEVWEYRLMKHRGMIRSIALSGYDDYWLYFADGKLSQWGQAGDWARDADRIYEIRFR